MDRKRFLAFAALIVLVALGLREYFVLFAEVVSPLQGDASAYMLYVRHMLQDGVFGMYGTPDAFRGPGYPLFLAAFVKSIGPIGWMHPVQHAQALLGTATVALTIVLAREWLSRAWALAVGALMAFQAHHIVATAFLLSEVVFGFLVVLALLLTALALRKRSLPLAALAGAAYGLSYLVNPVVALFPFVLAVVFLRQGLGRAGGVLLLVSLLAVGGWSVRNSISHAHGDDRAAINFVQGSWPLYHNAANNHALYPAAQRYYDGINAEIDLIRKHPSDGVARVLARLRSDPATYAQWYASKVYLLWDWDIRIGSGGLYTQSVDKSPLERNPTLRLAVSAQRLLNPLLFVLAFAFALAVRRGPALVPALFVLYVTAVYTILQAEPRYSIPFRSVEILLAVGALAWCRERVVVRGIVNQNISVASAD